MRAKKSFGQHFLTRPEIAKRISDAIPADILHKYVVEVGPGRGALTQHLVEHPKEIIAIEADKEMIPLLEEKFATATNLTVVRANFLKYELEESVGTDPFVLIGNFPYNISSQIIFRLIDYRHQCPIMIGMFQKELADRLISGPGSKTYGAISVLVQVYFKGKRLFNLPPGAFNPPPKVTSTVISLERRETFPDIDYADFKKIVKMAFGQRRKKIRNTIGNLFETSDVESMDIFQERPEQLGVPEFLSLLELYNKNKTNDA